MVLILSFCVNLDGRVIDIIKELCKICKIFYVLNFIKFYMYILYFSLLYIFDFWVYSYYWYIVCRNYNEYGKKE